MDRAKLDALCDDIFGKGDEPIATVASRAAVHPEALPIVWEGDATTFQFTYVSPNAEGVLGYPVARWHEPGFWAERVVHPDDRNEAVAYCALATAKKAHHEFEYRAVRADGTVIWLLDVVRVVLGRRGVPERLRGLMFELGPVAERPSQLRVRPTHAELEGLQG